VWHRAAEVSKHELECDYLSFISGIDWQPAPREGDEAGGDTSSPVQPTEMTFGVGGSAGRMQLSAPVQSTKPHWGVTLKTDVDERDPHAESWVATYPGADWHERECWEMYGVAFDGHPSLRHLYLPSEFEGHPLRKDYPLLARIVKPWPRLVARGGRGPGGVVSVDFAVDRQAWRHLADAQVNVELDTGDMILNLGPQHPATHGTLRLVGRPAGGGVASGGP